MFEVCTVFQFDHCKIDVLIGDGKLFARISLFIVHVSAQKIPQKA